jgi:D-alanyl-D-alanine-carboxypeptidase/D-alanyl-D-alanine-endopeptidase
MAIRMPATCGAVIFIIGLASATLCVAQGPVVRSFPSDSALRVMLEKYVSEKRSVGIVVGLLEANGEQRVIAHGSPGAGKLPLDGNSVFLIASNTKAFTGTLLASLIVDGTLAVDDPVQRHLPTAVKVPQHNGRVITLRHLATHTSAIARMPSDYPPPGGDQSVYTVDRLYAFISGYTLPREPGSRWEYSNAGVSLLGHALAHAAGKSYEQLITERITMPLGMEHTAITRSDWMEEHLAAGHDPAGNVVAPENGSPAIAPAGGLNSTANDLLRFLAANINAAASFRTDTLGQAMALAQRTHYEATRDGSPVLMGLNWHIRRTPRDTIIWQGGGVTGYGTFIAFAPSRRQAVVVLTNSGTPDAYDFGFRLFDPSLPPLIPAQASKTSGWILPAVVGVAAALLIAGWRLR